MMARKLAQYSEIHSELKSGDVIAFGGKGQLSHWIKLFTKSPVSHVAVVFESNLMVPRQMDGFGVPDDTLNWLCESTTGGVQFRRVSQVVMDYDGDVWVLPLSDAARAGMDLDAFHVFLLTHKGKPYDDVQLTMFPLGTNREDFRAFFCSELVAGAHEAGKVVPELNASNTGPIDICRFSIYKPDYYQLKGDIDIPGYNTTFAGGWGT
jgi:hypothetical protein